MNNIKDDLKKIEEIYEKLLFKLNEIIKKFPEDERPLVNEINNASHNGLRNLGMAVQTDKQEKRLDALNELGIEITILEAHLDISEKSKYISKDDFETCLNLIKKIQDILEFYENQSEE